MLKPKLDKEVGKRLRKSHIDQEIGKRLRKARKMRGYKSARAFAIKHKIPESTYSQHETGKRSLSPEIVLHYCESMNVDPGWLLSGKGAEMHFSSDSASVSEVSLHTSNRQAGSKTASMMVMDNLVTMDMDLFKGVLKEAIQKYVRLDVSIDKLDMLVEYCLQTYSSVAKKASPNYQGTEGDSIASS